MGREVIGFDGRRGTRITSGRIEANARFDLFEGKENFSSLIG